VIGDASIVVRAATADDAGAIARLLAELGYAVDPFDVPARLDRMLAASGAALLAVDAGGASLGFMSLGRHDVIHAAGPVAYITSLVTTAAARGRGVGRALVDAARTWAEREGCVRLSVTSAEHRADAHAFYPACGMPYSGRRFSTSITPR
jgi:GNAT superfamily N-acetyltransferase